MKLLFICIITLAINFGFSQRTNSEDHTYFTKYNPKLVSPETTQKHIFSIGTGVSSFTSEAFYPGLKVNEDELELNPQIMVRAGIGYHYLFLKNKKLKLYKIERFEHTGFGIYVNIYGSILNKGNYLTSRESNDTIRYTKNQYVFPQNELRLTYTNPFFSYRGKLFNFYFIHEYGFSVFRASSSPYENVSNFNPKYYLNISPLSIKFGTNPVYFKSTLNLTSKNNILQSKKLEAYVGMELQIYFYKAKKDED
ncbi:MAG: hypothetical protein AB8B74_11430 [Crocinitomicaceae bacterium]